MRNFSSSSIRTKRICESAIFYNLTADIIYTVCKFNLFLQYYSATQCNWNVTPHILLANMLSPKRLVCSGNPHMAQPIPNYPYILVNRSLLCNCHLQSGLMYLLKSLGSCEPGSSFTMYFTVNAAFQHYMTLHGLSQDTVHTNFLLPQEHSFNIFLNDTHPSSPTLWKPPTS